MFYKGESSRSRGSERSEEGEEGEEPYEDEGEDGEDGLYGDGDDLDSSSRSEAPARKAWRAEDADVAKQWYSIFVGGLPFAVSAQQVSSATQLGS